MDKIRQDLFRRSHRGGLFTEGSTGSDSHIVGVVCLRWCRGEDGCTKAAQVSDPVRQHESPVLPGPVPKWQGSGGTGGRHTGPR